MGPKMSQNKQQQFVRVPMLTCGLIAVLMSGFFVGCSGESGPRRVAVSGTVTVDGKPIESGIIRFLPTGKNGGPPASVMIADGHYSLSSEMGPIPGFYQVLIALSPKTTGGKMSGTVETPTGRNEWQQQTAVPDLPAFKYDVPLSSSEPVPAPGE